jgi:hypothetical protein
MRVLLATITLALSACGSRAPEATEPEPAQASTPSASPASGPRHARATRGDTTIELDDQPGLLVDGNAPPPPPGTPPATHPALSGHCIGEPRGCSDGGGVVRAARSFDEAVAGLRGAGFDVEVR